MIVTLAGGVGAARFLEGVVQVVPQHDVTAIVNTGDDMELHGLLISPDLDIVICTLAGQIDVAQGWGIVDDTYECMTWLKKLGAPGWFNLGDRDLALHIQRTALLRAGQTLTEITDQFRRAFDLDLTVLPMSNQPIPTHIITSAGEMHFEEYFVKRRAQDEVLGVRYVNIEQAQPAPGVLESIANAEAILIAPSNPIVSVGTILSVPGVRDAIKASPAKVAAVSPIVGGAAIKGPAVPLMRAAGLEPTALGIAEWYRDIVDVMVIDNQDANLADAIRGLGMDVVVMDTIMRGPEEKRALAQAALSAATGK
jgi:LPPG:FO 2-phospho-L-lactate transferase